MLSDIGVADYTSGDIFARKRVSQAESKNWLARDWLALGDCAEA